ncbi:uncharacterized protein Z520_11752 [Fonsecaea multimorphosa CBS 102226]|uniref:SET domain-containing protein n=1 Tax=Fonsecaea multimorphosa CBS 102226 TaxID=1442371 RepID=A0A0D2I5M8_9EURO|nr:uncharacterized protein Z520_11752 [Fonsecaea multimorphosa CBS 102226]KIX92576.1 hypothetical protein Z520_11752 [Fonsecaea multimorphosa CBS 102226]OAL17838.1 hypothetical protein AYO22_11265 [Fonsecaea multimorphosa]
MADLLEQVKRLGVELKEFDNLLRRLLLPRPQSRLFGEILGSHNQFASNFQAFEQDIHAYFHHDLPSIRPQNFPPQYLSQRPAQPADENRQLDLDSAAPSEAVQSCGDLILETPTDSAATPPIAEVPLNRPAIDEDRVGSASALIEARASNAALPANVVPLDDAVRVSVSQQQQHAPASRPSQPDKAAQDHQENPRNPVVTIPYRKEGGIIVLLPSNMAQCHDMPFLLSQAEALGTRETGVFKYVLPGDFESAALTNHTVKTRVSRFSSRLTPKGILHISRTESTDLETLELSDNSCTPRKPDELAEILEGLVADPNALKKMRYATDIPARTTRQRQQLGLPAKSAIYPLKGNQLDRTRYTVPGIHWPYAYLSGCHGALFAIHSDDGNLISVNMHLSGAERLWYVVAPKDGHIIEKEAKKWTCAQRVRHASRWIPRAKLQRMGARFVNFIQRPGEGVVTWDGAYHQGGTDGSGTAEAVNYGYNDWNMDGYHACETTCPGFPVTKAHLEFRAPGEPQIEEDMDDTNDTNDPGDTSDPEDTDSTDLQEADDADDPEEADGTEESGIMNTDSRHAKSSVRSGGHQFMRSSLVPWIGEGMTVNLTTDRNLEGACKGLALTADPKSASSKKRQRGQDLEPSHGRKRIAIWAPSPKELERTLYDLRQVDKIYQSPCLEPGVTNIVLKLAAAVMSRTARAQFCSLVSSRRNRNAIAFEVGQDLSSRLAQYIQSIKNSTEKSILEKFSVRTYQALLAEELVPKCGRQRVDPAAITTALKQTGWKITTFRYHLQQGRKWMGLCGDDYSGLLGFIFLGQNPFKLTASHYLDLEGASLQMFHRLLKNDYITKMCEAGRVFQETLQRQVADREFTWEAKGIAFEKISEEDLLPFPTIDSNVYHPGEYPKWSRPEEWSEDWVWPCDPTWIPPEEIQCDMCRTTTECGCISLPPRPMPRIKLYDGKGRGLQAVGSYRRGEYIGELTGELVPPGTFTEWCFELKRPDTDSFVCQLYCGKQGNFLRLLNHGCLSSSPAAEFVVMKVSGRYRVMVKAARDIQHGEEITAFCGKGFMKKGECLCEACRPNCQSF